MVTFSCSGPAYIMQESGDPQNLTVLATGAGVILTGCESVIELKRELGDVGGMLEVRIQD
jgi:hypothetical protein